MDKQLVLVQNNQVVVSSRDIAEHFEKEHKHVLESIKKLIENQPAENSTRSISTWFYETTYIDQKGEQRKQYLINRDGFSLLVMGFTGQKALEWKIKYIEAFNAMEEHLRQKPMTLAEQLYMQAKINIEYEKRLTSLEVQQAEDVAKLSSEQTKNTMDIVATQLAVKDIRRDLDQTKRDMSVNGNLKEHIHSFFTVTFVPMKCLENPDLEEYDSKELYRILWNDFYKDFSEQAHVNLTRRLTEMKKNKTEAGVSKTKIEKTTKLDVIVNDDYLIREIKNYMKYMETQYDILLSLSGDREC